MRSWIDFWNADTPIYVNARHKQLHYQGIAQDMRRLLRPQDRIVLDYGCGEAVAADDVANACDALYLCDAAANTRTKLTLSFGGNPKIRVVSPEDVAAMPGMSFDTVIVNSVLQYIPRADLPPLIDLWREKLKPAGRLILADIIPPDNGALADAGALLRFGASGGFFLAAIGGLVRTALSDYRKFRTDLGLSTYTEAEMLALLMAHGFAAQRLSGNIGHNPARMAFEATALPSPA